MQNKWGQLSMCSQPQQKSEDRYLNFQKVACMWHGILTMETPKTRGFAHEEVTAASLSNLRLKVKTDQGQSSVPAGWERLGTKKKKQNKKEVTWKPDDKIKTHTHTSWRNKSTTQHPFVCLFSNSSFHHQITQPLPTWNPTCAKW